MSDKVESAINAVAALLALFSAMVDPRISAALAVIILLAPAGYRWFLTSGATSRRWLPCRSHHGMGGSPRLSSGPTEWRSGR